MSTPDLRTMVLDALDDERKAEATYEAVIEKFGPVRPFIRIVDAERRHGNALIWQCRRLGLKVPANRWAGKVEAPESIAEACKNAIQGEIDNIDLYDELIPHIRDTAVRRVFETLRAASRDNHLPAFRRCLARQAGNSSS